MNIEKKKKKLTSITNEVHPAGSKFLVTLYQCPFDFEMPIIQKSEFGQIIAPAKP